MKTDWKEWAASCEEHTPKWDWRGLRPCHPLERFEQVHAVWKWRIKPFKIQQQAAVPSSHDHPFRRRNPVTLAGYTTSGARSSTLKSSFFVLQARASDCLSVDCSSV
jgi:hypothetical protein